MFFISFFTLSLCSLQFHVDLIKDEVIRYHSQSSGLEIFTEMLFTAFQMSLMRGLTGLAVIKLPASCVYSWLLLPYFNKNQEKFGSSWLGVCSLPANTCVSVSVSMPVPGWNRKDYTNKGGSANQQSVHIQPGSDSHIHFLLMRHILRSCTNPWKSWRRLFSYSSCSSLLLTFFSWLCVEVITASLQLD